MQLLRSPRAIPRASRLTGGGKAAVERPEFRWVNTILGNIKSALRGTYHAIRPKYAQRYLAEFEYRFNRRFDLPDIIPRLVYVANPADAGAAAQVTLGLSGNRIIHTNVVGDMEDDLERPVCSFCGARAQSPVRLVQRGTRTRGRGDCRRRSLGSRRVCGL